MKNQTLSLDLDGKTVEIPLYRKKIKRVYLRVRADGSIFLSAPLNAPREEIARFLRKERAWLEKILREKRAEGERAVRLSFSNGEMLPIEGVPTSLFVRHAARFSYMREKGALFLFLPRENDEAARRAAFLRFAKEEARTVFAPRLENAARRFGVTPLLRVKWMKTRWGSCAPAKNTVVLNAKLLFLSPDLADAVILHELCHFRVPDHSKKFYRELSRFLSDPAGLRRALARAVVPTLD